jgi:C1A family cysteine protease
VKHLHRYLYRPPAKNHPYMLSRSGGERIAPASIPDVVDLRPFLLPPRDQGQEGCCSGFATAALREALHNLAASSGSAALAPPASLGPYLSPAYLYARTRMVEGTFPEDSGATIADEMSTLENYGVCLESDLPYTGDASETPTPVADVAAAPERISSPACLNSGGAVNVSDIEEQLAVGLPVVFGMPVYSSFESIGPDGVVPVPDTSSEQLLGGHAMLIAGHRHSAARFIVRNSWSTSFGDGGYIYLPYCLVSSFFEAWTAPLEI